MSQLDPNILLQSKPVDLSELGDSLNPANIYSRGLQMRQQKMAGQEQDLELQKQQREAGEGASMRKAAEGIDWNDPQAFQNYTQRVASDPAIAYKAPEIMLQRATMAAAQATAQEHLALAHKAGAEGNKLDYEAGINNGLDALLKGKEAKDKLLDSTGQIPPADTPLNRWRANYGLPLESDPVAKLRNDIQDYQQIATHAAGSEVATKRVNSLVDDSKNKLADLTTPKLDRIIDKWSAKAKGVPTTQFQSTIYDPMLAELNSAVPAEIKDNPKIQAVQDKLAEKFKANSQINMAVLQQNTAKGLPDNLLGAAIDRIHNRQSSVNDEIGKGRMYGIAPDVIRQQLIGGVNQKYGENYDPSSADAGQKLQQNPKVGLYNAKLDQASTTLHDLLYEIKKNNNLSSQTAQGLVNKLKSEFDNGDVVKMMATAGVTQEELGPAYSGTSAQTTDAARGLAKSLDPSHMDPEAAKQQINALLAGMARNQRALHDASYGFVKLPNKAMMSEDGGLDISHMSNADANKEYQKLMKDPANKGQKVIVPGGKVAVIP